MRRTAVLWTLLWGAACSDDQAVSAPLHEALVSARQVQMEFCSTLDACYPDYIQEDGWCTVPLPDQGALNFERGLPHKAADACWQPLHHEHPDLVLKYFACSKANDRATIQCLASCPSPEDAEACTDAWFDAANRCASDLWDELPFEVPFELQECMDERVPSGG